VSIGIGGNDPPLVVDAARRARSTGSAGATSDVAVLGLEPGGVACVLSYLAAGLSVLAVDVRTPLVRSLRSLRVPSPSGRRELRRDGAFPALSLTTDPAGAGAARRLVVVSPPHGEVEADAWPLEDRCRSAVRAAGERSTVVLCGRVEVGHTRCLLADPLSDRGLLAGRDVSVGVLAVARSGRLVAVGGMTRSCAGQAAQTGLAVHSGAPSLVPPEAAELSAILADAHEAIDQCVLSDLPASLLEQGVDPQAVLGAVRAQALPLPAERSLRHASASGDHVG
jgi:UDP-N-acetyl-D-glucosamine dehydrogenase